MKENPFKLHTRHRMRDSWLLFAIATSILLNFVQAIALIVMGNNQHLPRIAYQIGDGPMLPLATQVFTWNQETAISFVKIFLPLVYTFSPQGTPPSELYTPFISPALLEATRKRFEKDKALIESEGYTQTLKVQTVELDESLEMAHVTAELRRLKRNGTLDHTTLQLTIDLLSTSDPLNLYGHAIHHIR